MNSTRLNHFNFNKMKILLSALLLLILASCATVKSVSTNKKMDIYILMGQSNMAGRGPLIAEDSIAQNKKVLMFTQDFKWVAAKNPLHFDKPSVSGVGPGLSFGLAMQANNKTKTIALVPTAVGGTSINAWTPGGYDKATKKFPWDDAEKRIIEAMKYGTIKGVIWHQGESDSNIQSADIYLPKLVDLIKRVRALTGNENLPFIVGQLGRYNPQYENINKQTAKLPALVPHTAIVSSIGLVDKGDHTHFDRASAIILGQRFAEKMLEVQNNK